MNKNNLYILIIFCFIFIKIQIIGRQNLFGKLDNFNSKNNNTMLKFTMQFFCHQVLKENFDKGVV